LDDSEVDDDPSSDQIHNVSFTDMCSSSGGFSRRPD
jgi:hypothetical protein